MPSDFVEACNIKQKTIENMTLQQWMIDVGSLEESKEYSSFLFCFFLQSNSDRFERFFFIIFNSNIHKL